MNFGDKVGMGIFMVFAFAFITGVFYEFFGARKFVKKLYFIGLKLINFKEDWGDVRFQERSEPNETSSGKFKVLDSNTALFHYYQGLFSFRVNTPLPFKGLIEIKDGIAHISARIPLAPSIFIGIWLAGWTFGGLLGIIGGEGKRLFSLMFMLGGWGFLAAMLGYSYVLEKKRLLMILEEIKSSLGVPGSSSKTRENEGSFSFEWKQTLVFAAVVFGIVQASHYFMFNTALEKVTEAKDPQKLRLSEFESAFALDKNKDEKNQLRQKYETACETKLDHNCRLLGYLYEIEKDSAKAFKLYVKSCSQLDPHSCYNIISNKKMATKEELEKAEEVLEPICSNKNRNNFQTCCDCYEDKKEKGEI